MSPTPPDDSYDETDEVAEVGIYEPTDDISGFEPKPLPTGPNEDFEELSDA